MSEERTYSGAIAIVGMAGRFPDARNVEELWRLLSDGREATTWLSEQQLLEAGASQDDLENPNYVKAAMMLPDMEMFDAEFFGFSPREASILDPQHRHFLECCWEALEDAGHVPRHFPGSIGVFGGCGMQSYMAHNLLPNAQLREQVGMFLLRHTGNDKDFLTTRVSYLLDLKGPSVGVQTACSTSLVAVHFACQSLLAGECDMALAGGASIELPHGVGYIAAEGEILSPNGRCAAFDDNAQGTIFGSGVAVVTLRRLEDAIAEGDNIQAIILGTAINNDGKNKAGYLAPSVDGQAQAAAEALAISGIEGSEVDYIEAHGTGTVIGDPIELTALQQAYQQEENNASIAIGSIKTNIGHLDTAAGTASLIKVVLGLKHEQIPASLNFHKPNSRFDFPSSPFQVAQEARPWLRNPRPRRAGVNSLGVGGTNAHAIVEEAPRELVDSTTTTDWQLLTLSAKTSRSLHQLSEKWLHFLRNEGHHINLAHAAFTTHVGRERFAHRLAVVGRTHEELTDALQQKSSQRTAKARISKQDHSVVFMFPGGGSQYPGVAKELYQQVPTFREAADQCFAQLPSEVSDLPDLLFGETTKDSDSAARLEHPQMSVLAVFVVSYALAKTWEHWGVTPDAVVGHSAGDYVAAVLAGVMKLSDALDVVALRGQLFSELEPGGMLSVQLPEEELRGVAGDKLDIAALNGPMLGVLSGSNEAIEQAKQDLDARQVSSTRIRIGVAAHSRMLDSRLQRFHTKLSQIDLSPPKLSMMSSLTGDWVSEKDVTTADYWVRHLRETVRFGDSINTLLQTPGRLLVEVGPGQGLTSLARLAEGEHPPVDVISSTHAARDNDDSLAVLHVAVGKLWVHGVEPNFSVLRGPGSYRRVSLPTYAFERKRHWVDPPSPQQAIAALTGSETSEARSPLTRQARFEDWFQRIIWQPKSLDPFLATEETTNNPWLLVSDGSAIAQATTESLAQHNISLTTLTLGDTLALGDSNQATLMAGNEAHAQALVEWLDTKGLPPSNLLFFATENESTGNNEESLLEEEKLASFDSLVALLKAIAEIGWEHPTHLTVVGAGVASVQDEPVAHPELATLLGPVRVWPRETPGARGRFIDIQPTTDSLEDLAQAIVQEANTKELATFVALREGQRYVETHKPLQPSDRELAKDAPSVQEGGSYLITGGLGDLGRLLTDYLVTQRKARVALVTRQNPENLHPAITAELEKWGEQVFVVQADVTDRNSMKHGLEQVQERWGQLHGVFHAAGMLDDAPIAMKTRAETHRVLAPKVMGGLVLSQLLPPDSLELFAVFSSTSALLGPPGQVDYVGGNAFLDALAAQRPDGLSIHWGIWKDTGLATRARLPQSSAEDSMEPPQHPLLGNVRPSDGASTLFQNRLDAASLWVLREHIIADVPVLPGTAYIEMAQAAMNTVVPDDSVALEQVELLHVLHLPFGGTRLVETHIAPKDSDTWSIEISSRKNSKEASLIHFRAQASVQKEPFRSPPKQDDVEGSTLPKDQYIAQQDAVLFGPRWDNIVGLQVGTNWVRGQLSLPPQYRYDLGEYKIHPALLDMAASLGLHLIPEDVRQHHIFAPVSAQRIRMFAPLPEEFTSEATLVYSEENHRVEFDILLTNQNGDVLGVLERFALRSIPRDTFQEVVAEASSQPLDFLQQLLANGLTSREAPQLFEHVLHAGASPIVASSIALTSLDKLYQERSKPRLTQATSSATEPSQVALTETERAIQSMFSELLGVEKVGLDDEFLDLGGHSLTAVRLFARIRKKLGVDLGIATLFEAPSVRKLAALLDERLGRTPTRGTPSQSKQLVQRSSVLLSNKRHWSPLVKIADGQPKALPLFWIHGAAGNIVSIKPLADKLKHRHPLYGLQAHGVDGSVPPQEKIEDMAASYVAAIREVTPYGPYCLLGYSGGGVIAYEMAQQFSLAGQSVGLLAMIDTLAASHARGTNIVDWVRYGKERGPKQLLEQVLGALRWNAGDLAERWIPPDERARAKDPLLVNARKVNDSYMRAQSRYFTTPYEGTITLFRAEEAGVGFHSAGPALGWDAHVGDRVEIHPIHADHSSIILPPAIHTIAAILSEKLKRLEQQASKLELQKPDPVGPPLLE
ncbi:MAG: SDR family NAD(P)-dependent oxidoreductase [Deltaproteobacteria bacterium]|nr:MAG: SDR family NAD(P)-dependent oxidoreductase [Deltaproteobacteria bacterium]